MAVFLWVIPAETYQTTLSSVLRGTGFEVTVLLLYFIIVYVIGIFAIIYLAFIMKLQLLGLLLGILISTWILLACEAYLCIDLAWTTSFFEVGRKFSAVHVGDRGPRQGQGQGETLEL